MSVQQIITEALHYHRELMSQDTRWDECVECSHQGDDWATHVAKVLLSLPDIAIVELAEVDERHSDGCLWFSDNSDPGTVGAYPGDHVVWGTWECTPEQARVVASQWLAAANAAEKAQATPC